MVKNGTISNNLCGMGLVGVGEKIDRERAGREKPKDLAGEKQ